MTICLLGALQGRSVVTPSYRGSRFPSKVISHCVWLYYRFHLSLRDLQEPMPGRGIEVSHETVHQWTRWFGPAGAAALRRRRPGPGGKGHPVEVFIKVSGMQRYPWRAVDQHGNGPGILLRNRRDEAAARRFFRKLMKRPRTVPRVIVTDRLRSHGAAHRALRPSVEHRSPQDPNNRAEGAVTLWAAWVSDGASGRGGDRGSGPVFRPRRVGRRRR
ncbi:IS6 family transposase [Streptomyces sp. NPDC050388]|uniref:IS6 family transposase n=1 Tax=Streptomyces sp. NPDC050388 TaxID=3155781 RepID=UPI003439A1F6